MRIISGKHKGRRITAPSKLPVRPTTDMAKEALFNILNNQYHISELKILDLFSGTGNLAFEFGSRGAKDITAVDAHFDCVKFIKKTSEELELSIIAIKSDVYKYLEKGATRSDLIFADPPYDFTTDQFGKIAETIFDRDLLNEDGTLIIEHSKHTDLNQFPHYSHQRKYGSSVFSFFE